MAGKVVPGDGWRACDGHQAGRVFLRHATGRRAIQRRAIAGLGRQWRAVSLRNPGQRPAGIQDRGRTRGPEFDPDLGERVASSETLKAAREYVGFRFPGLRNAPLLETRVCQYEQTPDAHLIVDRHPGNEKVWILGGGSGHGFKHGAAIGEVMAEAILKDREPEKIWSLGRFRKAP